MAQLVLSIRELPAGAKLLPCGPLPFGMKSF
jgi:hypothetical protein